MKAKPRCHKCVNWNPYAAIQYDGCELGWLVNIKHCPDFEIKKKEEG